MKIITLAYKFHLIFNSSMAFKFCEKILISFVINEYPMTSNIVVNCSELSILLSLLECIVKEGEAGKKYRHLYIKTLKKLKAY